MGAVTSQITSLTIVYSTVYSGADQRKHQSSASLAFVWGIHKGPVTRKIFPFDDVIMLWGKPTGHRGPVMWCLRFSLLLEWASCWTNDRVRAKQIGRYFCSLHLQLQKLEGNICILIQISPSFVPCGPVRIVSALELQRLVTGQA